MTRFGEILPIWQNYKSLWTIFWMVYLVIGKHLYQTLAFYATGRIFIVVNGQRLNSNKAIWSHWKLPNYLMVRNCSRTEAAGKLFVRSLKTSQVQSNCKFLQETVNERWRENLLYLPTV